MTSRTRRAGFAAIAIWAAAWAATAATLPSPVRPASSPQKAAALASPGQSGLDFDASAMAALRGETKPTRIEGFPVAPGVERTLVLQRFEVLAEGARITASGPDGETSVAFPSIAHFSGRIEGEENSRVYVGAQDGRLVAYIQSAAGLSYVGPDEQGSYVVRSADSPISLRDAPSSWACGAEEMPAALTAMAEPTFPAPLVPLSGLKQAAVRIETDYELYAKFNNLSDLGTWVATLYGAINVIYERDLSLHLALAEVHAWTAGAGSDPYASTSTRTQLDEVGDWWHANKPPATNPRAFVHFLSGKAVSGGVAWMGVLCAGDFNQGNNHWGGAYGVTQVNGTYPLGLWDQMATAHEMGHNVGSAHTHCYVPAIDHCYNQEPGCYSGAVSNPGAGNGTIMSYCHLLGWQYISLVFHPRCIAEQMAPRISSAACLTQASTFIDVPPSNPFFTDVEILASNGVTNGCGGAYYCPNASVTRAQMAAFLLKAKDGGNHTPPACTGTVFGDVICSGSFDAWIEELASLGISSGCGGGNYCPNAVVTRRQMSAFLLKAKFGSAHVPPSPSGVFADVPASDASRPWVEELYTSAITSGCLTNPLRYCPDSPNTRGQMAVFLVKTFNLQ